MTSSTSRASFAAPSTPSGALLATPITAARPPLSSGPEPATSPSLSTATSWPAGNNDLKISSSVMALLRKRAGDFDEGVGWQVGDRFGRLNAERGPNLCGVGAGAKALKALFEPGLFGQHGGEIEARRTIDQLQCGVAETRDRIVGEGVGDAKQRAVLAAHGAPD